MCAVGSNGRANWWAMTGSMQLIVTVVLLSTPEAFGQVSNPSALNPGATTVWPRDVVLTIDAARGLGSHPAWLRVVGQPADPPASDCRIGLGMSNQRPLRIADANSSHLKRSTSWLTINVLDLGAIGDGIADDTRAFNDAFTKGAGRHVHIPAGTYKVTSPLVLPAYTMLTGDGVRTATGGVSRIHGVHTGAAVLSLKGSHYCVVENLDLYGDATTTPDTVLLVGRSSAASAGSHRFRNVKIGGYANKALAYSVASELNTWQNCVFSLAGGLARHAFYTDQVDALEVDMLAPSSNFGTAMLCCEFYTPDRTLARESCLYMEVAGSTGLWMLRDCYFVNYNDSWVRIRNGVTGGGDSTEGPILFDACYGEPSGTGPDYGIHVSTASTQFVDGVSVRDCHLANADKAAVYATDGAYLRGFYFDTDVDADVNVPRLYNSTIHMSKGNLIVRGSSGIATAGCSIFANPSLYTVQLTGTNAGTVLQTAAAKIASHDYRGTSTAWIMTGVEGLMDQFVTTNAGGPTDAIFPVAQQGKVFTIYNNSGQTITVKVLGQSGSPVASGKHAIFTMSDTDTVKLHEQP